MNTSELFLVFLIALLVLGPKQLPQVANFIGRIIGKLKRFYERSVTGIEYQMKLSDLENNQQRAKKAEEDSETKQDSEKKPVKKCE